MIINNDRNTEAELLTPRELAAELRVSVATVARWRKLGCPYVETRPLTMGKFTRPRYRVAEVATWLEVSRKGDRA